MMDIALRGFTAQHPETRIVDVAYSIWRDEGMGARMGSVDLLREKGIEPRLNAIYENWMVGALRIRAKDGSGVAWLPRSVVQPDLESGLLTIAGGAEWWIDLDIRLHRLSRHSNSLTRKIWAYLSVREDVPLLVE